ncbi:MAG: helix-turn-helix transcriptional regulator [Lachnospiraceae bacterium]|nr:helix-turn-helix transcriptional regulator [Lachnospiraceae bacterium]
MANNDLGNCLKMLRNNHGYSQAYVASQLNIIRQTYSHYETGRIIPKTETLMQLANLYEVPLETLAKISLPEGIQLQNGERVSCYNESELLYYFRNLEARQQEEILDFMKYKYSRSRKKSIWK